MFLRGIQLEAYGRHINWDKRDGIAILSLSLSSSKEIEFERIEENGEERRGKEKRKEKKILEERGIRKRKDLKIGRA